MTPCQARTISIMQPAEGGKSCLDGTVGIPQVYNAILAEARRAAGGRRAARWSRRWCARRAMLRWATPRALPYALRRHRYISVPGLPNVIRVFDDVERGKLKDIDFLECYACWAGCGNGNLTVDNVYVGQAKLQTLMAELPDSDPETEAEIERRYPHEDFSLELPFAPRVRAGRRLDCGSACGRVKEAETVAAQRCPATTAVCAARPPAACWRTTCRRRGGAGDCVLLSPRRLAELRRERPQAP